MNQLYEAIAHSLHTAFGNDFKMQRIIYGEYTNWCITDQIMHAVGVEICVIGNPHNTYCGKVIIYEQGTGDVQIIIDPANPNFSIENVIAQAKEFADTLRAKYLLK